MNAKEIGRKAGRIFSYLLPPNWIYRSQEDQEDYGIDAEIELVGSDDKATGFIFKVQVKGQENVTFVANGAFVSFDLKVERLRYYMRRVEMPVILVVVDVSTEQVFWASLQDSETYAAELERAAENNQKTVAVRLPSENVIPDKIFELQEAVKRSMDWSRLHALDRLAVPISELIGQSHDEAIAKLLHQAKSMSFEIYNEQFDRLFVSQDFEKLGQLTRQVIESPTELVQTRLSAGIYIERVMRQHEQQLGQGGIDAKFRLYLEMLEIVRERGTEPHLRRYVAMLIRVAVLQVSVKSEYHFHLTARHLKDDKFSGWIAATSSRQANSYATKAIQKAVHLLNRSVLGGHHGLFVDAVPRIIGSVTLFIQRLKEDGVGTQSDTLLQWLKFCIDIGLDLANQTGNIGALAQIIIGNAITDSCEGGKGTRLEESLALAEKITDPSVMEAVIKQLNQFKIQDSQPVADLSPEQEVEKYRDHALALGIDVSSQTDEMGKVIAQGLLDYNPERVIKNCESLVMIPSRVLGIPARMVGLPTAGSKTLHCLKKGHTIGGWSLDNIYSSHFAGAGFSETFCSGCDQRQPRSDSWKWSSRWQFEITEQHREIFMRLSEW